MQSTENITVSSSSNNNNKATERNNLNALYNIALTKDVKVMITSLLLLFIFFFFFLFTFMSGKIKRKLFLYVPYHTQQKREFCHKIVCNKKNKYFSVYLYDKKKIFAAFTNKRLKNIYGRW